MKFYKSGNVFLKICNLFHMSFFFIYIHGTSLIQLRGGKEKHLEKLYCPYSWCSQSDTKRMLGGFLRWGNSVACITTALFIPHPHDSIAQYTEQCPYSVCLHSQRQNRCQIFPTITHEQCLTVRIEWLSLWIFIYGMLVPVLNKVSSESSDMFLQMCLLWPEEDIHYNFVNRLEFPNYNT